MTRPEVVIVTGSRDWTDELAISECLNRHPSGTVLIHGGCRGADRIAMTIGKARKFTQIELPYFEHDGREARNESMVAIGAALQAVGHKVTCYGFPIERSVGTFKCMRLMRKAGLRIANWEKQEACE